MGPDWGSVVLATVTPGMVADPDYVSLLVATIGTTIAPWMIFLAQNNVVDKNVDESGIALQRVDTVSGSVVACAIAWFIIVTTATVLHPEGIEVADAADAALRARAHRGAVVDDSLRRGARRGELLSSLRAAGRDLERDLRGVRLGARRGPYVGGGTHVSRHHHGIIVFSALLGNSARREPLRHHDERAGDQRRALAGAPVFLVLIARDKRILGRFRNGRVWNALTWATIVLITVLTVVMFVLQALGF